GRQFRVAAEIDDLAYRYREREVVFVVSSGNLTGSSFGERTHEQIAADYPAYLVDGEHTGLVDPATAAIALTVGGLSYGTGRAVQDGVERDVAGVLAPERGWPSPFTRTGPGVGGSIKPDFVDYAGTWRFERGRIVEKAAAHAGVPTTARNFAPPEGRLLRTVAGTSFAAPRVAHAAARLFQQFPTATSNLIRALLASSAWVPKSRPERFSGLPDDDKAILRVYGYGQPDYELARRSAENDVWMLDEASMAPDSFRLYEIPALPEEFLTAQGAGTITVALAFDPPTRSTRGDSYLGISMEFALYRNSTAQAIADAWRDYSQQEKKQLGSEVPSLSDLPGAQTINLAPGTNARKKGTLQRARCRVKNSNWSYDRGALVLAVVCRRHWAPVDVHEQRYAVVVSYAHENSEVRLHSHVRQHLRVHQRARLQL
ncbi:MAG: S8 family serine peptidase, partial [Fimbriimonadaceae bacterium]|nr:S8 family serine peptidase [Fimbriimonadaceae bacterium]